MPADLKITTEILFQGALFFALVDAVYVPLLAWRVSEKKFRTLKWPVTLAAGLAWFGIWSWAIGNFWETVYSYLFPPWAQTWIPFIAAGVAPVVGSVLWALSVRARGKSILVFCLSGGLLGGLSHIWAVHMGVVTKPPMLQGASPLGAITIALFEFIFYWCSILVLAVAMDWTWTRIRRAWRIQRNEGPN